MPRSENLKNIKYWRTRFEMNQKNLLKPSDDYIIEVERIFKQAERDIEKEIALWYQRFADNNGITAAEARKTLNKKELAEFKWNVNVYIKRGRENGISADWSKELENASARVHIRRLEALKLQCGQCIESLYNSFDNNTGLLIESIYKDSIYHTAYEIAKGTGIGTSFTDIDTERLKRVISKRWSADGKNFSERIWGEHRAKLVNTLYNQLSRGILTGRSPDKIIDGIAKTMKTSRSNASRLVMTESAYFASAGQVESYKRFGVKRYQILGTLDDNTCDECGALDGKVFDVKEFEIGATAPLFHPRCRCTTVPYFDDEFTEGEKRFARDEDGNGVYVDADMAYKEWKEKFVENNVAKNKNCGIMNVEEKTMSLEYQRYGRNKDTTINSTYVNGGEYRNKFDKITNNKDINRILYNKAKEMLNHRSGTMFEDMYWVDEVTGEIITSALNEKNYSSIVYSNSIKRALIGKNNIIALHTHPSSMPPSISDFNSAFKHKYNINLIICHNGKVFYYTSDEYINERLYNMYISEFESKGYEGYEAQLKTLEKLKETYKIDFWEVE